MRAPVEQGATVGALLALAKSLRERAAVQAVGDDDEGAAARLPRPPRALEVPLYLGMDPMQHETLLATRDCKHALHSV